MGGIGVYNENGIPTSIKEREFQIANFKIFPNPANQHFQIKPRESSLIYFVEIIALNGNIVKQQVVSNDQYMMDIHDLVKGIYIVRIYSERGLESHKLIKN